jgi:hypothetical protein
MPSDPSSQDSSKNAAAIVGLCRRELEASGFVHRKGNTLWRRSNLKFDVLKFDIIPRTRCQKWRVPFGSFGLDPSCLFPFLPRLGHLPTDGLRPEKGFGQVRLALRRGVTQRTVKASNIWWAGDSPDILDMVLKDVLRVIREEAIRFFGRFEDAEEVLRTFLDDEDAIGHEGIWEFGKKGSPSRLLYTGFAAIECARWDAAISSLRACREKIMTIPPPVGESVQAEILPYVDQGIACAEQKRPWPGGVGERAR